MAKKKTVSVNTKNPSGLTITRKDNDITFKWKITDANYGAGQQLQWRVNKKKWHSVSIGKTATSKTVSINLSNFKPTSKNSPLNSITFRVRGQRSTYTKGSGDKAVTYNPKWSDWVDKKLTLRVPRVPNAHATLSDTYTNVTNFSWSVNTSNTDRRFFRDVQYQTCLVKSSGSKGSAYDKRFGNTVNGASASGSFSKTEDSAKLAQGSYTRWYRFRSRGSKGNSNWKYVSHTYARPYQAVVKEATLNDNGKVYVKWTAASPSSNKITSTTVQYAVATPDPGLECPAGASWTDATVSRDTKGTDAARFPVDQLPGLDECLWVRVNTTHDRNDTYGVPYLVENGIGYLTDPSGLSVSTDDSTHKAVITATNDSAVTDSFLAITYRTENDPENDLLVGIIPNGSSSVTVQCPNWDDVGNFAFGVQAVVGTYEDRSVDYGNYEIEPLMASQNIIWAGGTVPVAPSNVTAQATERSGIVRVGWDWDWQEADIAVISWSEEPTAWESTSEPSTYEINNMHAAQWYIAGLETGMTWYIRVKLVKTNGDARTEGPWSEVVALDLSSAPVVPVLELSSPVMTADGDVTASWAYSSTDGTDQAYAEITTVEVNGDGVWPGVYALSEDDAVDDSKDYFSESGGIYTLEHPSGNEDPSALGWYEVVPNIIAHTETAQHVTLNAEELGWSAGDEYNLAVRVVSASGRMSDSWSDPVGVTVAEAITATITETSLADYHVVSTEADTTPYLFRPSPALTEDYDRLLLDKVVGGTLAVNQLFNGVATSTADGITTEYNANTHIITITNNSRTSNYSSGSNRGYAIAGGAIVGHTYISVFSPTVTGVIISTGGNANSTVFRATQSNYYLRVSSAYDFVSTHPVGDVTSFYLNIFDLTQMFGSTIADYVYNLEQSTAGSGVAWLKQYYPSIFNSYQPYNAGTLESVQTSAHVMTGFNQWDEEWETGGISTANGGNTATAGYYRSKNYIPAFPNTNYYWNVPTSMNAFFYDTDKNFINWTVGNNAVVTTPSDTAFIRFRNSTANAWTPYNNDICINVSSSRNGEYEPYTQTSYPLDSDLVLRGIPKLNNGVPYYDGDEYASDGSVNRRYGIVDMGSLNYVVSSSDTFYTIITDKKNGFGNIESSKYPTAVSAGIGNLGDKQVVGENGGKAVYVKDSAFSGYTAAQVKSAMSGVYLIYELQTPTTETADPFTNPQVCYKGGTEEFVASNVVPVGNETEYAKTYDMPTLTEMPLTATITGAGTGGTTTLAIERSASYYIERPDGTDLNGYEGETIALETQVGEDQITIDLDNLIGRLDDGASYRLVATVNDDVGQSDETTLDFEVHWAHQALIPTATATIDTTQYIAKITPTAPAGALATDVVDIYRLSADKPQLVVENGTFGTTYVDPYPTIGEYGGHRVVFKTENGDYITEDNHLAWVDLGQFENDNLDLRYSVIDFDGQRLECDFNQSISNSFSKDFKETQYLGGSVQGDWNPAISRSSTVNTVFVNTYDPDAIRTLRALAAYPGICHVRTKDGSSYAADVQVGDEVSYDKAGKVISASLTITRVDPEGYDGMSLADWEEGTA